MPSGGYNQIMFENLKRETTTLHALPGGLWPEAAQEEKGPRASAQGAQRPEGAEVATTFVSEGDS